MSEVNTPAMPAPTSGASASSDRIRRVVFGLGCLLAIAMEVWLLIGVGGFSEGATIGQHLFFIGILAVFAFANMLPFVLYRQFVKTTTMSIIGGVVLISIYIKWFSESDFHPGQPLFLMAPLGYFFWGLMLSLIVIALDGALQLFLDRTASDRARGLG